MKALGVFLVDQSRDVCNKKREKEKKKKKEEEVCGSGNEEREERWAMGNAGSNSLSLSVRVCRLSSLFLSLKLSFLSEL